MPSTQQPELTIERFSALVEAYGSDLDRFPRAERTAAKQLALSDKQAQALLAAARVFDTLLASARSDLPSAELEQRLYEIPDRYVQQRPSIRLLPFRTHARAGFAAAAAVLLGLLGGQLDTGEPLTSEDSVGSEQADIASLTFADDLFDDLSDSLQGGTE
jgi:hypothetical protein